ncbi:MAG: DUF87 domain-containing protein [Candidatus Lokiarchaeota archaeon]|nr:DUF87 domain-containing protein [Candidatus Lokiarchaeota archaeon]
MYSTQFLWSKGRYQIAIVPCFISGVPVPFFKPLVKSDNSALETCLVLGMLWIMVSIILLNILSRKYLSFESIESKWRRACLHIGLTTQTNLQPDKDVKEFPTIVSVNPESFVVSSKGITPEQIQERRAELNSSMGLFIGDVRYLAKPDGSTHANLIELTYSWNDLPAHIPLSNVPIHASGEVVFGLGMDGYYAITLENMVHLGISGETGSGKSVFIRQLITQLLVTDPHIVIVGIDFKGGVEFSFFEQLGNFVCADDFKKTGTVLKIILKEYQLRLQTVRKHDCDSIYDLTEKGTYVPPVVILVDEAAEFFGDKKQNSIYEDMSKIARLGRFAGIHLMISTQRADVDAIPQQIRSMLTTRVIFRVSQKEDSIMFIGSGEATKLRKLPGRFYLKDADGQLRELQAPYISKSDVKAMLRQLQRHTGSPLMRLLKTVVREDGAGTSARIRDSESVGAVNALSE